MKVLVIGGSGTVGSHVVANLVAKGQQVNVLSRSGKPSESGAQSFKGDLSDPPSLRPAFANVDSVFLLNAVSQSEANDGIVAVNFARAAKAKRLVYMSVQNLHGAATVPHFGSKIAVEAAVKASGVPYTILQPNMFCQNDTGLKDLMVNHGVYGLPIGDKGTHRVDVRDIADAAVNALTAPHRDFENKTFVIAGPKPINGPAAAEVWSAKLGKKIAYVGNDLDAWEKQASNFMPSWVVFDMRCMLQHFQDHGLLATDAELAACQQIVGHPLRTFADYVREQK